MGERKQEFLESPGSLQEFTDFAECSRLWQKYDSVVAAIKNGETVPPRDCNFCTVAVVALFCFFSWQRAGAVENCTLKECHSSVKAKNLDGSFSIIISVKRHKTAQKGPANLVLAEEHSEKLLSYVETVMTHVSSKELKGEF